MSPAVRPRPARRRTAVLAWTVAGTSVLALVAAARLSTLSQSAGLPDAQLAVAAVGAVVLATVSAAAVGALLAGRRPDHPVGWLLLGIGAGLAANVLVEPYVKYGLLVRPGSLPAARYLAGLVYVTPLLWLSCAGFVLLLTPTGRLPSPRWGWWARLAAAAPVVTVLASLVQPDPLAPDHHGNPLAVPALSRVLVVPAVAGVAVILSSLPVGAWSLVARFRRAPRGRAPAAPLAGPGGRPGGAAAAGRARRRLRLRRRRGGADVAGPVRGPAAAGHRGGDPALPAVRPGPDHQPDPGLRGLIEAFGARLRDQVDLDTLCAELLGVVDQTMAPTRTWLWLRPPAERGR